MLASHAVWNPVFALWVACAVGAAAWTAFWSRRWGAALPPPGREETPSRRQRLALVAIVCVSTLVRLWYALQYPLELTEAEAVYRGVRGAAFEAKTVEALLHAPLHPFTVDLMLSTLGRLPLPLEWLPARLPSIVAAALVQLALARAGRAVGAAWGGLAAAAGFGGSSFCIVASLPAENYVYEAAGAAWLLERTVQYTVARRPVFPSLGVAAAMALWCGFMNGPFIALAGVTVLAVAVRRDEWRALVASGVIAGLLLLPVASRAVEAGLAYREVSRGDQVDAATAERIAERERHPVLKPSASFSSGRIDQSLVRMSGLLFGPDVAWLPALALALLAVRTPWAGVVLALALLAFPVAGQWLLFNTQNYVAAIPVALFMVGWGFDLRHRAGSRGRRRVANAVLAITVVVPILDTHDAYPLREENPEATTNGRFFNYFEYAPLRAAVDRKPPAAPVVFFALVGPYPCIDTTCAGAATTRDRLDCLYAPEHVDPAKADPGAVMLLAEHYPDIERRVAGLRAAIGRPVFATAGVLFVTHQTGTRHASLVELADDVAARCPLVAETMRYKAWLCDGPQAASLSRAE